MKGLFITGLLFLALWVAYTEYRLLCLYRGEVKIARMEIMQDDINATLFRRMDALDDQI